MAELLINRKVLFAVAVNTAFPFTVAVAFCASELCEDDDEISIAAGVTWLRVIMTGAAVGVVLALYPLLFLTLAHQWMMY